MRGQIGKLVETNSTIKENLKVWLNNNKILNDTIDLLNARIVNIGVDFTILADLESNKYDVLSKAIFNVKSYFKRTREVGEPIFLSEIRDMIRKTNGVVDIIRLKLKNKTGGIYSGVRYNIENNMSADRKNVKRT